MHRIRFKGPRGSASKGPFCVINWAIEEISFKVELLVHPTLVLSVGKDYPVLGYGNKPPRLKHWISFTGDSEYPRGLVKRYNREDLKTVVEATRMAMEHLLFQPCTTMKVASLILQ